MKRFILSIILVLFAANGLIAQNIVIGERAPDLKVKEWLGPKPAEGLPRLIEFFYSSSAPSLDRLAPLDKLATKYASKMSVVLIAKESREKIMEVVKPSTRKFSTALDDAGKSFSSYGVQFVPFSVLVDSRGKVLWMGNSASLTDQEIEKYL